MFAALLIAGLAAPARSAALALQSEAAVPTTPAPPTPASPAAALPFSTLAYEDAHEAATAQGRLFIVDAVASWSGPCQRMERGMWSAAPVLAWMAEHAIVTRLDVDAQKALARELDIDEPPTIVVIRGSTELARRTDEVEPGELVSWLADVAADGDGTGPLLAKALKLLHSDDIDARYDVARELVRRGETELSLQHYLWLWPNTRRKASYGGVRLSFMLGEMKTLAERDEDAHGAFEKIYADVRAAVADEADPELESWQEFSSWCRCFDHQDDLLAWRDAHEEPDGSIRCDRAADSIFELLADRGEWAEAGGLGHLAERADTEISGGAMMEFSLKFFGNAELKAEMKTFQETRLRKDLSRMCAAAWAAGHEDEGRAIAGKLLRELDDNATRLMLAAVTLQAVGARTEQSAWLDEAAGKGGDADEIAALREKIVASGIPEAAETPVASPPIQPASPPESLR